MIAHILLGSVNPLLVMVWLASAAGILAGAVLLFADLHRRAVGSVLLAMSIAATVVLSVVVPWPPTRPDYAITVLSPSQGSVVAPIFRVTVCGRLPDGSAADVPGADRVVSVSLDGHQAAVAGSASLVVDATTVGAHRLQVEVLDKDHREFSPPILVDVPIVVGLGSAATPGACPG